MKTYQADSSSYRYGFNGTENEPAINDGFQFTEYRLYNSKIGRWCSTDPLEYLLPESSPYVNNFNNPIVFKDQNGDIGIPGFLFGIGMELAGQLIANGGDINKIDWLDVGIAGVAGIIPGGAVLAKSMKAVKYAKGAYSAVTKSTKVIQYSSHIAADAASAAFGFEKVNGKYKFTVNDPATALTSFAVQRGAGALLGVSSGRIVKVLGNKTSNNLAKAAAAHNKAANYTATVAKLNSPTKIATKNKHIAEKVQEATMAEAAASSTNKAATVISSAEQTVVSASSSNAENKIKADLDENKSETTQNKSSNNQSSTGSTQVNINLNITKFSSTSQFYYLSLDKRYVYDAKTNNVYDLQSSNIVPISKRIIDVNAKTNTSVNIR